MSMANGPIFSTLKKILNNNGDNLKCFLVYDHYNGPAVITKEIQEETLKSFIKKFCNNKNIRLLQSALSAKSQQTQCILYNLDSEVCGIQLAEHPHLEAYKLFCDAHVTTYHELCAVRHCTHPYYNTQKMQCICINPYHYELMKLPANPRVLVPLSSQARSDVSRRIDTNTTFVNGVPNLLATDILHVIEGDNRQPESYYSMGAKDRESGGTANGGASKAHNGGACNHIEESACGLSMTSSPLVYSPTNSLATNEASPRGYLSEDMEMDAPQRSADFRTQNENGSGGAFFERMDTTESSTADKSRIAPELTLFEKILDKYSSEYPHGINRQHSANEPDDAQMSDQSTSNENWNSAASLDMISVEYTGAQFWCTVAYYEGRNRVGTPYVSTHRTICIDGFTSPSDMYRLCLGHIENVNRTKDAISVRSAVGRGIRLYDLGGDVYFENLGEYPVFIQIPIASIISNYPICTVYKFPPACNQKVFAMSMFRSMLDKALKEGYDATLQLKRLCTMRLSFIKGWGMNYRRQYVTETPCWLEIHLNGPLDWLDSILEVMGPSPNRATSYT